MRKRAHSRTVWCLYDFKAGATCLTTVGGRSFFRCDFSAKIEGLARWHERFVTSTKPEHYIPQALIGCERTCLPANYFAKFGSWQPGIGGFSLLKELLCSLAISFNCIASVQTAMASSQLLSGVHVRWPRPSFLFCFIQLARCSCTLLLRPEVHLGRRRRRDCNGLHGALA